MTEGSPLTSARSTNVRYSEDAKRFGRFGSDDYDGDDCSPTSGVPARRYADIPANDRLIYPRGNKTDKVFAGTQKPDGFVPPSFMPIWPEMPLDSKLPSLPSPKGILEKSRRKLGESLYRPEPDFTLSDPMNKEKVITSPYNAFHDPHAKDLLGRPYMQKLIKKNNIVDPEGNVRCSIREFNDFRRYLNTRIYRSGLTKAYDNIENIQTSDKEQLKAIRKYISETEGDRYKVSQKVQRAKDLHAQEMVSRRQRLDVETAYTEFRAQAHGRMLQERLSIYQLRRIANESIIKKKQEYVRVKEESRRKYLVKKILAETNRINNFKKCSAEQKATDRDEFLMNWLSVRCDEQQKQIEKALELKKTVTATLKRNAMKHQMKVDQDRANLPQRIEARRKEQERIWSLVRKFFFRWLDKVRARKASKPDEFHQSFWTIGTELDTTVAYLRKESGYEKFDDFIMNIVKLKREIKAELESEEAAEAAAALGIEREHHDDKTASHAPSVAEQPIPAVPQGQTSPASHSTTSIEEAK